LQVFFRCQRHLRKAALIREWENDAIQRHAAQTSGISNGNAAFDKRLTRTAGLLPPSQGGFKEHGRTRLAGASMKSNLPHPSFRHLAVAAFIGLALPAAAVAQNYPQSAAPPGAAGGMPVNPVCTRLEAQLAAIDRGAGADPARADQARRLEDTLNKQQADLDRNQAQWQRLGCQQVGLFSIFAVQAPACGPLGNQIQQMRASIDRTMSDLQRTRRLGDDEVQRDAVIGALAQNNCGPQYRVAAPQQRGFFETLFGGPTAPGNAPAPPPGDYPQIGGGGYRTICVRTCDGYYFPISYSTSPTHFADDEQACQRQCPATEAVLYSVHNSDGDVSQAVASNGRTYRELANAFRYRREFVASCGCRAPGQSWADALGAVKDSTIERGDIVVTEERAKALSQPVQAKPPASPARQEARRGSATMPAIAPADVPDPNAKDITGDADPAKRPVRTVGPTFIPAH
jgi:hypothetical protein